MLKILVLALLSVGPGAQWQTGSLQEAIETTGGTRPILLVVQAHWCSPCNVLAHEVLDAEPGHQLLNRAVGLKVDFDTPGGREVTERYGVLSLPTVLILRADGTETGRVEGYRNAASFLAALEQEFAGQNSTESLRQQLEATPGDLDAMVSYAQSLLVHGEEDAAHTFLLKGMAAGGTIGARSARIWGRWLVRVKQDGPRGAAHFLEWLRRYRGEAVEAEFRYWAAEALWLQGKREESIRLFDEWIARDPRSYQALISKVGFQVRHGSSSQECVMMAQAAMTLDPEQAWPHYLLAELRLRQGDRAAAVAAIRRAVAMEPGKPIFLRFGRTRLGLSF